VADVGGEPGVALDPGLQGGGHVVERRDEHRQVGVVGRLEPGVETASGDRLGGEADVDEGEEGAAAGPPAERGTGEGGDADAAVSQ
jgi:hypothetical protein